MSPVALLCTAYEINTTTYEVFQSQAREILTVASENCIHIPHQSCTKICLQLIGSHGVASVNACLCLVSKMIIYDQSKTLPHTKYTLINLSRRASEIAVLHLRNPNITESSTSSRWVLHLPPKIQSVRVTKLRLCKSRFSGTLFLIPISICVYTCVSVWWL